MAQAARLSLRMQKELKLLLSDPPPSASFPSLSSCSDDSTSLTAIDAQIEGPKGTVYENGYFQIKIQIPERYPFQPPVVTFATPIYHPNIDTGGRICLDILNLPPKGAWQPSLNISTVITSIGLLLSEPNPDDGLMCEASKEYKYNRQAFDKKARTMTEKYANALSSSSSNEGFHISSNSCQGDEKGFNEVRPEVKNFKLHSKKLSLQSLDPSNNSDDRRLADQSNIELPNSQIEVENRLESKYNPPKSNGNVDMLSEKRKKLSLEGLCQSQKMSSDKTGTTSHTVEDGSSSLWDNDFGLGAEAPVCQKFPADCSSKMLYDRYNTQQLTQPATTGPCPSLQRTSSLKPIEVQCVELKPSVDDKLNKNPGSNKKLNLGYQVLEKNTKDDNIENITHVALHQTTSESTNHLNELHLTSSSTTGKNVSEQTLNSKLNSSSKHQGEEVRSRRLSLRPLQCLQATHNSSSEVNSQDNHISQQVTRKSEVSMSKEAIVMDSEDEEEKTEPVSSKVMVSRRRLCLAGKRKAK